MAVFLSWLLLTFCKQAAALAPGPSHSQALLTPHHDAPLLGEGHGNSLAQAEITDGGHVSTDTFGIDASRSLIRAEPRSKTKQVRHRQRQRHSKDLDNGDRQTVVVDALAASPRPLMRMEARSDKRIRSKKNQRSPAGASILDASMVEDGRRRRVVDEDGRRRRVVVDDDDESDGRRRRVVVDDGRRRRVMDSRRRRAATDGVLGGAVIKTLPTTTTTTTRNCMWRQWQQWSECTVSCGGGDRQRHRNIKHQALNGGRQCRGPPTVSETCQAEDCPTTTTTTKATTTTLEGEQAQTEAGKEQKAKPKKKESNSSIAIIIVVATLVIGVAGAGIVHHQISKKKAGPGPSLDHYCEEEEGGVEILGEDYDYDAGEAK